jgi:hypothetical protein
MKEISCELLKKKEQQYELRQHLLCQQITAESDAAAEGDGDKIGALGAFAIRP